MTRHYECNVGIRRTNEEYEATQEELYQAGRDWGLSGNTTIPRWYTYDRGDGSSVQIPLRGHSGTEFVRGWKETRPMPTATKKARKRK